MAAMPALRAGSPIWSVGSARRCCFTWWTARATSCSAARVPASVVADARQRARSADLRRPALPGDDGRRAGSSVVHPAEAVGRDAFRGRGTCRSRRACGRR